MADEPALVTAAQLSTAHVERETRRVLDVVARSPLAVHVPSYPGFTVESLAAHVGRALRTFHRVLSGGASSDGDQSAAPKGTAVVEWIEAGLAPLLTALREVPADRRVTLPHSGGEQPASTVAESVAVEVGVHRWDLESVLGEHQPIPAGLAALEIDRAFGGFAPRLAGEGVAPIGGTVELRSSDTGEVWRASVESGRLRAGRLDGTPGQADASVTAPVADLALLVWKRWPPPRAGVEVSGSWDVLKRFLAVDYIPDPRTTPAH